MVLLGSPWPVVVPRETPAPEVPGQEMLGADGASLGAASVEVDCTGPQPSVDTGDSLWDLVMHGAGFSVPGSAAPSDAALTHGCSGVAGLRVSKLLLPGSPGFRPHLLTGGAWRTT
jgi:hypothetical protein